jgi:hypothetical protein
MWDFIRSDYAFTGLYDVAENMKNDRKLTIFVNYFRTIRLYVFISV